MKDAAFRSHRVALSRTLPSASSQNAARSALTRATCGTTARQTATIATTARPRLLTCSRRRITQGR